MSKEYIDLHYTDIQKYENIIEKRLPDTMPTKEELIRENNKYLEQCRKHGLDYTLIDKTYPENITEKNHQGRAVSEFLLQARFEAKGFGNQDKTESWSGW